MDDIKKLQTSCVANNCMKTIKENKKIDACIWNPFFRLKVDTESAITTKTQHQKRKGK